MEFVKGIRSRKELFNERLNEIVDAVVRYRKADMAIPTDWIIEYNATVECIRNNHKKYTMNFGQALELLKEGKKITRAGWNGKGMFAVLQKGYPEGIPCNKQTAEAWGLKEGDLFKVRPYFQLKTAQEDYAMWVPSCSDILSEDWILVE